MLVFLFIFEKSLFVGSIESEQVALPPFWKSLLYLSQFGRVYIAHIVKIGLIAENRIKPKSESLCTLILSNRFKYFEPTFKKIDDDLTSEHMLHLFIEIDEIADKANNLSRNGVVLKVAVAFVTLHKKFVEKLKYVERKLTRYLYVLLYPFQQKNRLNCEMVLPVHFQIFYYNLKQFGAEMRRKHTTFLLQLFQNW